MKKILIGSLIFINLLWLIVLSYVTFDNFQVINMIGNLVQHHDSFIKPIAEAHDEYQQLKKDFKYEYDVQCIGVGNEIRPQWKDTYNDIKMFEKPNLTYHYMRYQRGNTYKIFATDHSTNIVCDICKELKRNSGHAKHNNSN